MTIVSLIPSLSKVYFSNHLRGHFHSFWQQYENNVSKCNTQTHQRHINHFHTTTPTQLEQRAWINAQVLELLDLLGFCLDLGVVCVQFAFGLLGILLPLEFLLQLCLCQKKTERQEVKQSRIVVLVGIEHVPASSSAARCAA